MDSVGALWKLTFQFFILDFFGGPLISFFGVRLEILIPQPNLKLSPLEHSVIDKAQIEPLHIQNENRKKSICSSFWKV
jgi:hypothetical protein